MKKKQKYKIRNWFRGSSFLKKNLNLEDYTTLSRRQSKLEVEIPSFIQNESRHVVVDSTGIKIFGEGEWKVRQHG